MKSEIYGFKTALCMVIGVVIGSGIFFKADDILTATNGNIKLGLFGILIVGIGVLFGALTVAYYGLNDSENTGMIGYFKRIFGDTASFYVGWFLITIYFPAFIVITAEVCAIYLANLFAISSQIFISIAALLILISSFYLNIKSSKAGGELQIGLTVLKLIPLIIIGLIGTLFFNSTSAPAALTSTPTSKNPLSMLVMIAFAFDGWIVATNISGELKDSKKNLPKALAFGTIVITLVYALYFYGISQIINPQTIISLGDAHTEVAAKILFGNFGGIIITIFVILSVYGGLNGMVLAYILIPEQLITKQLMRNTSSRNVSTYTQGIVICIAITLLTYLFQQLVDYNIIFTNLEVTFDLSSLPMVFSYILYTLLYIYVNKLVIQESIKTRIYYGFISFIAIITSLIVIYGSMIDNGLIYISICSFITLLGYFFKQK